MAVALCAPDVAVTTYEVEAEVEVGVPEITPVVALITKPAGNAGDTV